MVRLLARKNIYLFLDYQMGNNHISTLLAIGHKYVIYLTLRVLHTNMRTGFQLCSYPAKFDITIGTMCINTGL